MTKDEAKQKISELVNKYERETNKNQSEADVRAGYIDLLFDALGWNVYNDPAEPTRYRREGYIRGGGIVDVGLEIAGQPVLMLEAKKFGAIPRSNERLGDRTLEEKQLFRYARGKKIPYCILTNFERLQVFNADHERLILWFDDPEELISRLAELLHLSPEKIQAGSLPSTERQLEIKPVDESFLALLQDWRLQLANAIYEHNSDNPALKTSDAFDFGKLMEAVQRLLDRLILIRYADDKEVLLAYDVIENILSNYRKKGAYASTDHLMRELINFSHMMDKYHNTTMFQPGHICEQVFIPNNILDRIISEINNISFRKFASDILGNTYETYLSTKLVLKNGVVSSEERVDIRKAGGIYYTPSFIVHYMVDNTLGHLLSELENEYGLHAIEKAKEIRVVDPACGSGSFLIYAYQVFADYYRRMNEMIENERLKLLVGGASSDMFERMETFKQLPEPLIDYPHHILEKQLYGVDIDSEAAEIAAVNLTMQAFSDTKREKLPLILNENIKVGNSLVSGTEEELRSYFGDSWQEKNPFNWQQEFSKIMAEGGFDIVIGNPPYVRQEQLQEFKPILQTKYECYTGIADIYVYFYERGFQILKEGGLLSYISPNKYFRSGYGQKLRQFLSTKTTISQLIDFGDAPVFNAITYPSVIILLKSLPAENQTRIFTWKPGPPLEEFAIVFRSESFLIAQKELSADGWRLESTVVLRLLEKLRRVGKPLGEYVDGRFYRGIVTGLNEAFVVDRATRDLLIAEHPSSAELLKPFLRGRDVKRWLIEPPDLWLIFTRHGVDITKYPAINKYLNKYKKQLMPGAEDGRKPGSYEWYEIQDNIAYWKEFEKPKIAYPNICKRNEFAWDDKGYYINQKAFIIPDASKYLLGILNSTVVLWLFDKLLAKLQNGYYEPSAIFIKDFPIPVTNETQHIESLVNRILAIKDKNPNADVSELEHQIDQLVYQLYGLNEEERKIVEENT
ncbi:MAG: TaqI-like C-terminal specificity domain-containing protein [Dehalococcoidia bacterium]|nr:TaqI-like C-terminal specificity domain-containing protein [Dehalococcoidia bacterium]